MGRRDRMRKEAVSKGLEPPISHDDGIVYLVCKFCGHVVTATGTEQHECPFKSKYQVIRSNE
jgi:hypothetical protein